MEMIAKRVHVSGLNQNISENDLQSRFSSFGIVTGVDGVGTPNALGQPRKFAYVTLETTKEKYSRCLNLLSGTIWKGAKLRLGEAKPDFRQRLEQERSADLIESDTRPRKRRKTSKGTHGVESADMSIITELNYARTSAWRKTPQGHLIRPMRMRPSHPLKAPQAITTTLPKRRKAQLTRARRQKIDPTAFGSVHLSGRLLETDAVVVPPSYEPPSPRPTSKTANSAGKIARKAKADIADTSPADPISAALREERSSHLTLLAGLFGDAEEWGGREDSVAEEAEEASDGYEENLDTIPARATLDEEAQSSSSSDSTGSEAESSEDEAAVTEPQVEPATGRSLKDLFAPVDSTSFSILAGLDLDLDDEEDLDFDAPRIDPQITASVPTAAEPTLAASSTKRGNIMDAFDLITKVPYFFPLTEDDPRAGRLGKDTADFYMVAAKKGWTDGFKERKTSLEIQQFWTDNKLELTRDWKQRHREAYKKRRRLTGVRGDEQGQEAML